MIRLIELRDKQTMLMIVLNSIGIYCLGVRLRLIWPFKTR